ncbi:MAG TPA: HlyD family efflux transporter periplasmic adaptor subunit [Candidatus Acidoferrales bacterium]|nr:HlyD family efflux transporter periplasmic adaptor subunit [Candidatus Acidoferrales bacterium]
MKVSRFFVFLMVIFVIAALVYVFTTPSTNTMRFTGIIMGNDYIVSPQIQGRLLHLNVDEGSWVKKGELIAEIDPAELEAARNAAAANIGTFQARLAQSDMTRTMSDQQTEAALRQAEATVTATQAQLDQAKATLALNKITYERDESLFKGGVLTAQERDTAEQNYVGSQANVKSLEDQVRSAQAQVAIAKANRRQVDVQQADVAATRAQLQQSIALKNQAQTQLGYTKIYSPADGIVSVRAARQGETVQAGGPIVTVLDIDHLWVQADVEETYIDQIKFGQKLQVELPSGNKIEGEVFYKGVEGNFATQRDVSRTKRDIKTFAIKVAIPNAERRLFTGMTAYVLLPQPANERRWFHF